MLSPVVLAAEVNRYQAIGDQLRQDFAGIDEDTLADTLEGLSALPDILNAITRSSLEDEALAAALKTRIGDMRARLERIEHRHDRKRDLVCAAMSQAALQKLSAEDFSVSLRQSAPRLDVKDESKIPAFFLIPQPPRVDRAGLLTALKRGEQISGAELEEASFHIQVRTR